MVKPGALMLQQIISPQSMLLDATSPTFKCQSSTLWKKQQMETGKHWLCYKYKCTTTTCKFLKHCQKQIVDWGTPLNAKKKN